MCLINRFTVPMEPPISRKERLRRESISGDRRIEQLGDLPTLPHVVQKLASMIGRPNVSAGGDRVFDREKSGPRGKGVETGQRMASAGHAA
jgi:hypothetical protein